MSNYWGQKSFEFSEKLAQNRVAFLSVTFLISLAVWAYLSFFPDAKTIEKMNSMLPSALNTLVGVGITVMITTFSFVFVALSLVSVQFSPRVVRHFWQGDNFRRFFLWIFVAVFGFCFVIQFFDVPQIQLLALTCGVYLIFVLFPVFLGYLANNLNVSSIINNLSRTTVGEIEKSYEFLTLEDRFDISIVRSKDKGFLERIETNELIKIFTKLKRKEQELTLQVSNYVGSFIEPDSILVEISPSIRLDKKTQAKIAKCFRLNKYRSINQDIEYGIRQLVDIAIKAISPAVNDPTTCINCLNYLGVIIKTLATREEKSRKAKELELHGIYLKEPKFEKFLDDAFNQIYQWGKGDYIVVKNIINILTEIVSTVSEEKYFNAILSEIEEMELFYLYQNSPSAPIKLVEHQNYLRKNLKNFYLTAAMQADKFNLEETALEMISIAKRLDENIDKK